MGFFSNLFKGSQTEKAENNQEYVEYLLKQLEKAKEEKEEALKKEKDLVSELQGKLEK